MFAGLTVWVLGFAYSVGRLSRSRLEFELVDVLGLMVKGLLPAVAITFVFWLFTRLASRWTETLAGYLGALALGSASVVVVRILIGEFPYEGFRSVIGALVIGIFRVGLVLGIFLAASGLSRRRLELQVSLTDGALSLAREQQELLLEADERGRQQVASLLHDRVQAGLIAACLELSDTASAVSEPARSDIASVVHRLEALRAIDVRRAAKSLSPDLADSDLLAVLEELGANYAPAMKVVVSVDSTILRQESRPSTQVLLGTYRIIEQAVLNSAVHGRARECRVAVSRDQQSLVIYVDDDGVGMATADPTVGLGTALINAWVRILDGQWSLEEGAAGGMRVHAVLLDSQV